MGFLNVALVRLLNFSQFMEKIENWDFCFLAWVGCTFKITLSFTLRITISFIFRQIANLSDMYLRGGANLWWNCQFSSKKNVHIYATILHQFKYWKYCFQAYSKWGKKLQNFSGADPEARSCFWKKLQLFARALFCRLFYFRDKPWRCIWNFCDRYVPVVAFVTCAVFSN